MSKNPAHVRNTHTKSGHCRIAESEEERTDRKDEEKERQKIQKTNTEKKKILLDLVQIASNHRFGTILFTVTISI